MRTICTFLHYYSTLFHIPPYNTIINPASLVKSLYKGNSGGRYHPRSSLLFSGKKFPTVIFHPKKRSGIAVRVGKRPGLSKRSDLRRIGQDRNKHQAAVFCQTMPSQWITPVPIPMTKTCSLSYEET